MHIHMLVSLLDNSHVIVNKPISGNTTYSSCKNHSTVQLPDNKSM